MAYGPPPSVHTESALEDGRRRRRSRQLALGALAMAVALSCLAVWAWSSAGGGAGPDRHSAPPAQAPDAVRHTVETPPKSPEGQRAFMYQETFRQVGATAEAPGDWATEKTFAKGLVNYIKGFSLSAPADPGDDRRDRPAWQLRFPGPLCATTRHVSAAGRTAVAFAGEHVDPRQALDAPCDHVALVDLNTGEKLWQTELPKSDSPPTGVNVTPTDGAVAVAWNQGSAAYDMTHGRRLWVHTIADCMDAGFAGGGSLLALVKCGDSAAPEYRIERVDARTGRTRWTYRVARGIQEVYLASSSPAVIAVAAGDSEITDLISLGERGQARAIRLDRRRQVVNYDKTFSAVVESCDSIVVGKRRLFISTDNDIVAFDLATGKSTARFRSASGAPMTPLKMSGDELIAWRSGSGAFSPHAVVALDPRPGGERILLLFAADPDDLSGLDDPTQDDVFYEHGRMFFAARSAYGPMTKGGLGENTNIAVGVESVARGSGKG